MTNYSYSKYFNSLFDNYRAPKYKLASTKLKIA